MIRLLPRLAALAAFLFLAACAEQDLASRQLEDLGEFKLGHNIVVAPNPTIGPFSREATEAEWRAVMTRAIDERFGRYEGDQFYHIAIAVNAYALAQGGIPVVASPKSVLVVGATVWDDFKQVKLNREPEQITVFENITEDTVVGSGLTQTREEQMTNLARNAARAVERWLAKNPEWFERHPDLPDETNS